MTIGIIGAGAIGSAFAHRAARANIPAILSNSRGLDSRSGLIKEIGGDVRAGTRQEAAAQKCFAALAGANWSMNQRQKAS